MALGKRFIPGENVLSRKKKKAVAVKHKATGLSKFLFFFSPSSPSGMSLAGD